VSDATARIPINAILVRALHPPVRERAFWGVQSMVVVWAIVHIYVDLHRAWQGSLLPYGVPNDLLLIPVGYAALRYGLSGSAATTFWAILLWLPDLAIRDDKGQYHQDLVQLALVVCVAVFVGLEIERGHLERARAEVAEAERRTAEQHYHRLFDVNASPIFLLDPADTVLEANATAHELCGDAVGRVISDLVAVSAHDLVDGRTIQLTRPGAARDAQRSFRLSVTNLEANVGATTRQVVFEDVTEEYRSEREARTWATAVLQTQEDERRRIAREIHDDPLQRLLQVARRLEALESPAADDQPFLAVRQELLDVVARLRDVTRGLHPAGLEQHGLVAAVRGLLMDLAPDEELSTDFIVTGEVVTGSREAEVGLYRIIQEAVNNAVRHAHAHDLVVSIHFLDDAARVSVVDDGRGFDQDRDDLASGRHLGILSMRERAHLLDGRCEVRSTPGQGTTVEATIPLSRVALHAGPARPPGAD
jgi:signal transduction histidine kinase